MAGTPDREELDDPANAEAYTRKVMYRLQVSWWRRRRVRESVTADLPEPRHPGYDPTEAADVRLTSDLERGRTGKLRCIISKVSRADPLLGAARCD